MAATLGRTSDERSPGVVAGRAAGFMTSAQPAATRHVRVRRRDGRMVGPAPRAVFVSSVNG